MTLDQLAIIAFGVPAVALVNSPRESHRRWAPILGLAGQPFWFWTALHPMQSGVLLVCCLYTLSWGRGLWSHWIRPWMERRLAVLDDLAPHTVSFVPADPREQRGERVYLAGPVTGVRNHRQVFDHWARSLRASGYEVVSPCEHNLDESAHGWVWWMRRGLRQMLECDRIALIPGWRSSKGAVVEHFVAEALGMRPIYLYA